ncbi:hypothetical protein BDP55DRAFT_218556 [Colletotrichum godetiae]|uniref:Apple domain-containing protein n=1 Tax=Colletotrichum godetiae TaxID=1209918 RepID=A0AAJ0AGL8_9PEZI|nr:uncharacterized protein BDP55DRAFT_218556 [Colletotrichum godetiae]KAK1673526.1 hypothetical protein BDP55DRAFT_218556 [Colletotrichum godetiae]
MASLHPHNHFYSNRHSKHSSQSPSPEAEKMLKHPDGTPGPEADAIPDGLEVNTGANYSTAPQTYEPAQTQPYYGQQQHQHQPHTPQTNYTETTYAHNQHSPMPEKRPAEGNGSKDDGTICGLRKATFWLLVLSSLLFCALVGVAGGLSALVASKNSEIANLQSPSTSSSTATPTSASSAVAFDLSKPAATDTPIALNKCPGTSSALTYEVPGTNLTFSKDCGTDYLFNDIAQVPAKNFEECVRYCAAFNLQQQSRKGPCKGVVYIYEGEQGEDSNWCWMKYTKNMVQNGAKDYTESAWIL